jgi:phosphoribosylformimino-5-aminoimidazole carboxamide ribonucleotide (ProFAR) isomerase
LKVLPTLNIRNGHVLPLLESGTSGERSPEELVGRLLEYGSCRFDLTDLDAAQNRGSNHLLISTLIKKIRAANPKVCIQVGGGIRSSDQAQFFLDQGATWLVVGTVLHRYPMVVDQLLARFRDQLVASVDAKQGEAMPPGSTTPEGVRAATLAGRIRDLGFKRILLTDIPLDTAAEPDFLTAQAMYDEARIPLFMGGTIRTPLHMTQAFTVRGLQGVLVDAYDVLEFPEMVRSSAHLCS